MVKLFNTILEMSVNASVVIIAVILLRFVIAKAPKKYSYILWSVVGFRLCCPLSFDSIISIFRLGQPSAPSLPNAGGDIVLTGTYNSVPSYDGYISNTDDIILNDTLSPIEIFNTVVMIVWFIGMTAVLLYAFISYIKVHKMMANAILYKDNIYMSEKVGSPFTLGFIRPKIYIPFTLDDNTQEQILAHEKCHIKRLDHIIKPLSFLILSIHWFNPMCWLAFRLMSLDMEMSCDERVLKLKGDELMKKNYTRALLEFATNKRSIAPSPIAFSESSSNAKKRIKNALYWKKPKLYVNILCVILCIATLVSCAADAENARWSEVETESFGDVPYNIVYTSHGDGTCTVSEIRVDANYSGDIHLNIPNTAPNGDMVVAISAAFDNRRSLNLPRYMTKDGYEDTIKMIADAKEVTTKYAVNSERDAKIFAAFYGLKTDDEGHEYYIFEPYANREEIYRVSQILTDYGYGEDDCYNELIAFVDSFNDENKDEMTRDAFKIVYSNGTRITEITIPESVTHLSYGAFDGCDNLEKVNGLREELMISVFYETKESDAITRGDYKYISVFDESIKGYFESNDNSENRDFLTAILK